MDVAQFTVTGECSWYNATGVQPIALRQTPPQTSKVVVSLGVVEMVGAVPVSRTIDVAGTVSEEGRFNGNAHSRSSQGASVQDRDDSLSVALSSTAFDGTWFTSLTMTTGDKAQTCTRSASVRGTKGRRAPGDRRQRPRRGVVRLRRAAV